jgi:dTDP-4-dehydrorhamnose 3,5-epimerase
MPFTFGATELPGVLVVEPTVFGDHRGFFLETYKESDFAAAGLDVHFAQENHSRSRWKILRGLHYQRPPFAQGKLVRTIVGEIFDVAVDLRSDSPTFGKWVGVTLSADNRRSLYVPPWCAHGFCVLSDHAEVIYKTTTEYRPAFEHGIRWDDPALNINWPLSDVILSDRDRCWPRLADTAIAMSAP